MAGLNNGKFNFSGRGFGGRKFRLGIKNLTLYLICGYVLGYLLQLISPTFYSYLEFNPYYILHGQIWRLVTWVVTTPESLSIFTIIMLFLYYSLGTQLERTWGVEQYTKYILTGILFTVVGSFIVYFIVGYGVLGDYANGAEVAGTYIGYIVSTYYINMSIFLAFAATFPETQLMLYFIIPVKVKWFGYLYGIFILYDIISSYTSSSYPTFVAVMKTVVIVCSLLNSVIYMVSIRRKKGHTFKQTKRKYEYKRNINKGRMDTDDEGSVVHRCCICGRTSTNNPELSFRYCSKCTGNKEYCQDHLFTHTHS